MPQTHKPLNYESTDKKNEVAVEMIEHEIEKL
jgi:hypothetical protein